MTGPSTTFMTDGAGDDAVDSALARLATTPRLLAALDFDGTLAPFADDPMTARMLPSARAAVDALVDTPDTVVALVSGRSLDDLRVIAEHDDDSRIRLAGSHGAEYWEPGVGRLAVDDDPADVALRDRLRAEALAATEDLPGIWIEPKTFGLGVHTRRAAGEDAAEAYRRVDAIVQREAPEWRRRAGQHIVEYSFKHEGKDTAIATLRDDVGATAVLFAGDDVTDEDALRSLSPGDVGVHVGAGDTAASVVLPDIAAMADFLARLAALRQARGPDREAQ